MGDNAMINPHKHAGKDLEHVAEKMESWPKDQLKRAWERY